MRKIFTFLFTTLIALSIHSENTINFLTAQEAKKGIIWFVWEGDTAKSYAYSISIAKYDSETNTSNIFCGIAAFNYLLTIDDQPGILQCSTNLILEYGTNYTTIGSRGATPEVVARWKTLWEECVNESEYTLNPGKYAIYIFGVDKSYETTEGEGCAIAEIADVATQVIIDQVKPSYRKYLLPNGELYIQVNNEVYNVSGIKIK